MIGKWDIYPILGNRYWDFLYWNPQRLFYIYIYIYQFHMEIKYYSDIFGIIYDLLEIDIGLSKQLSW